LFHPKLAISILFPFCFRYVPSAKECPLLLQLPNGEISKTNAFISPVSYHTFIGFVLNCLSTNGGSYKIIAIHCNLSLNVISQMWGGVMVWNPQSCSRDSDSELLVRHIMSPEVRFLSIKLS
jgi:phosphatidylinositol glycan class S